MFYYAKFYRRHWMVVAKGSRIDPNISQDQVRRMIIPAVSLQEQTAIAHFLDAQTATTDRAIALQQQQIERLKEYKAVLIDSAVTGKIKVS